MSDIKTPSSKLESGEFRGLQKFSIKAQIAIGFAGLMATAIGMLVAAVIFVSARPTHAQIKELVQHAAPSQVEFARLQGELTNLRNATQAQVTGNIQRMSRMEAMLLKRLDRIESKLDELQRERHHRRGRRSRRQR